MPKKKKAVPKELESTQPTTTPVEAPKVEAELTPKQKPIKKIGQKQFNIAYSEGTQLVSQEPEVPVHIKRFIAVMPEDALITIKRVE